MWTRLVDDIRKREEAQRAQRRYDLCLFFDSFEKSLNHIERHMMTESGDDYVDLYGVRFDKPEYW